MPKGRPMLLGFGRRAAAGGAYVGPGDVISSASHWYGLRAYNAATIGNNLIRIARSSDSTETNVVSLSTGALDTASISTFIGGGSATVVKFYDQTGTVDLVPGGGSAIVGLTLSGVASKPQVAVAGNAWYEGSLAGATIAQPHTLSVVARRTGTAASHTVFGDTDQGLSWANVAQYMTMYAGAGPRWFGPGITEATFHALQAVFNGASSVLSVDGADATINDASSPGTNGLSGNMTLFSFSGSVFVGDFREAGVWPSAFSSGNNSAMASNQSTFWGF